MIECKEARRTLELRKKARNCRIFTTNRSEEEEVDEAQRNLQGKEESAKNLGVLRDHCTRFVFFRFFVRERAYKKAESLLTRCG